MERIILIQTFVLLGLIILYSANAAWRAYVAGKATTPASRLNLIASIVGALAIFVVQWMFMNLPGWAYTLWIPAAIALLYATWRTAQLAPDLPWVRPGKAGADVALAVGNGIFTALVIGIALTTVVLALR